MSKLRTAVFVFALLTLIGGCEKIEPKERQQAVNEKTKFFMGSPCAGQEGGDLALSEFYPVDAMSFSCLDAGKKKVYFVEKSLKVTLLKNGFSHVILSCIKPSAHTAFIDNNYDKDILLVVDKTLIRSFRVNRKANENDCGKLLMSTHEDAVLVCLSAQKAWGGSEEDCSTSCKDTDSEVCLDN